MTTDSWVFPGSLQSGQLGSSTGLEENGHVVLVGMRAAGKSTFGRAAADRLNRHFVDLDEVLEKEIFRCSVNAFVDEHGWAEFRKQESLLLEAVLVKGEHLPDRNGCVIATGGGVVETSAAFDKLKAYQSVIWVDRHLEDICRCLEGTGSFRPGLGSSPREVYERRRPFYQQCSNFTFSLKEGADNWVCLKNRFAHLVSWAFASRSGRRIDPGNPVCVPIMASSEAEAIEQIAEASIEGAGLVELRVDKITGGAEVVQAALPRLLSASSERGLPVVVTFRPTWEDPNAGYSGDDEPRLQVLRHSAKIGAQFIDVEGAVLKRWRRLGGLPPGCKAQLIVSSHNFNDVSDISTLRELFHDLRVRGGPDCVVKIAQMAQDSSAAARMLSILKEQEGKPSLALAMGEVGVFSRILAPFCGALFSFGSVAGRVSAPGQPAAAEMVEVYRCPRLTATKVFGVLHDSRADCKKGRLLNAVFTSAGCDAIGVPMMVRGCSVREFIQSLPAGLISGICVEPALAEAAFEAVREKNANGTERGVADLLLLNSDGQSLRSYSHEASLAASDVIARTLKEFELLLGPDNFPRGVREVVEKEAAKLMT